MNGKMIGVDYGDVRTGIASCDVLGMMASAVGAIKPGGMRNTAQEVARIAKEQNAVGIVVGLPKNMDGSEGPRADVVRAFVDLLKAETDLPIFFEDERMTTMEANRFLTATETFGKKRKEKVDALSAELILQSWLDRKRREEAAK
ncbi:MAG: Holliday junction resolvase RuvX [Clostridia bacterium]|nr:Holliday junction resolvase RuvX [Clostridia bacterium]